MKKFFSAIFMAICLSLMLTSCGGSEKTLNILTWDGYFPENVLNDFSESTGTQLNITNFQTNEEMLMKLEASQGGDYDIVIGSDYIIDIAAKQNLIAEIDKSKIPNYENIDPNFQNQYYDPENKYTIPYSAGTPLIVYDPAKVNVEIKGYADLWNTELKDSLVMLDDARNTLGITLKTMGKSFNETDPAVLEEAGKKLAELKPNIRLLDYNNPHTAIISGEASIGYMFTPQVLLALAEKPDLKVVYPEEGMGFGIDNMFIPAKAPNMDTAHEFLNYILEPEVGADVSEQIMYICCNKASEPYLSEEFKTNQCLYIPSEILGNTEFIEDVGDATEIFTKIWTDFKQQ